ncbi:WD40 repeat domain-containing protein [Maridesulfovibrio zosterae]|uniref:WD40 repeat domain-containing protein n=1 Tax=Maridesulfovibrio zosterae TaxID=82171 RepID=UPI000405DB1A|nr:WD40 repeat domain-containing protein [Maridesulfovibrio zosterae]
MILRYLNISAMILTIAVIAAQPMELKAASRERVGEFYIDVPRQLNKGTTRSLKDYVSKLMGSEYVSAAKLYDPPLEGLEDKLYISVKREKAVPIIAGGVSSYAGNEEGLAAALNDGSIRVWSKYKCSKLKLPGGGGAESVGYGPGSPTLAATSKLGEKLYVYDLEKCTRIPGDIPVEHGPVKMMSVSRTGDWMALIDSFNGLLCGPVTGPLKEISIMEGTPLYLGFTPGQGVLVAIEASGKIIKWGMKNHSPLSADLVPGGPFVSVRMSGYVVCLSIEDGKEIYWDLSKRSIVKKTEALKQEPSWIYEQNGVLVYSTGVDRWKITEHLGRPMFIVSQSVKEKLLRVRDLDGETRYYSTLDGKKNIEIDTDDWKMISPKKGVYTVGRSSFRLYDPVCQKGSQMLYSRYIEGKGFYLWWELAGNYAKKNPHPMELPIRETILADKPAQWVPLVEGKIR